MIAYTNIVRVFITQIIFIHMYACVLLKILSYKYIICSYWHAQQITAYDNVGGDGVFIDVFVVIGCEWWLFGSVAGTAASIIMDLCT